MPWEVVGCLIGGTDAEGLSEEERLRVKWPRGVNGEWGRILSEYG